MSAKIIDLRNHYALWDTSKEEGAAFNDLLDLDKLDDFPKKISTPIKTGQNRTNVANFTETHVGVDWENVKNIAGLQRTVEEMYLWSRLFFSARLTPIVIKEKRKVVGRPGVNTPYIFGTQTCLTRGAVQYSLRITNGLDLQDVTMNDFIQWEQEAQFDLLTPAKIYDKFGEVPDEWKEGYQYSLVEPEEKTFEILTNFTYPIVNVDIAESYKLPLKEDLCEEITTEITYEEMTVDILPTKILISFDANLSETLSEENVEKFNGMYLNKNRFHAKLWAPDIENLSTEGVLPISTIADYTQENKQFNLSVIFIDKQDGGREYVFPVKAKIKECTIQSVPGSQEIYSKTTFFLTREKVYKRIKTCPPAERLPGISSTPLVRDGCAYVTIHPNRRGFSLTKVKTKDTLQQVEGDYVCDVLFKIQYEGLQNV